MTNLKVSIFTFGCRVNKSITSSFYSKLETLGFSVTAEERIDAQADIFIVNSCCVTHGAVVQLKNLLRGIRRKHPESDIILYGCVTTALPEETKEFSKEITLFGSSHEDDLLKHLCHKYNKPFCRHSPPQTDNFPKVRDFTTKAFLRIQEGCDHHCTYCIVPIAKGPSRSTPLAEIMESIEKLDRQGYKEIVLSGTHIGDYGKDLGHGIGFYDLLKTMLNSGYQGRFRIGSVDPMEFEDRIMDLMRDNGNRLCPYIHLPLQSGDNGILKRMGRPYTAEYFRDRIKLLTEKLPEIFIGIDVIVGFPGETDKAFQSTYDLLENIYWSKLHVFPFSPRPGTTAKNFKEMIFPPLIKKRKNQLLDLGENRYEKLKAGLVGKERTILIEETLLEPSPTLFEKYSYRGLTEDYWPVTIVSENPIPEINRLYPIRIDQISKDRLIGHIRKFFPTSLFPRAC